MDFVSPLAGETGLKAKPKDREGVGLIKIPLSAQSAKGLLVCLSRQGRDEVRNSWREIQKLKIKIRSA